MADKEVGTLTAASALDGTELVHVVQSGNSRQSTTQDIADLSLGSGGLVTELDSTAWRVFYGNGTGDVTELALGASGTVLQSNGAAAAPTFATPSGGGSAFTVIDDHVLSADASVESDVTGYDSIEIIMDAVAQSTTSVLELQFSPDGGSTWRITSGDYLELAEAGRTERTGVLMVSDSSVNTEFGYAEVSGLQTAKPKIIKARMSATTTGTIRDTLFRLSETVNRIRIIASAGNMTSGNIIVRGR